MEGGSGKDWKQSDQPCGGSDRLGQKNTEGPMTAEGMRGKRCLRCPYIQGYLGSNLM